MIKGQLLRAAAPLALSIAFAAPAYAQDDARPAAHDAGTDRADDAGYARRVAGQHPDRATRARTPPAYPATSS